MRAGNTESIRDWLARAPSAEVILMLWQSLRARGALVFAAPATVQKWREAIRTRAEELMDASPAEGIFIYNTLFTVLDDKQRESLFRIAITYQKHALRTQPPAS